MAGAGYKLFNTGDVLTAAQVNTYLQEQAVMRFANSTARTTALSGVLAEGMMSYLDDTNSVEVYNGSSWVSVGSTGDITGVTAGTGISGGGSSGDVTITNSMATAIDAKGDLIVGTGADTFDRLAVGTNGYTLVADSGQTTGLKWQGFVGCCVKRADVSTAMTANTAFAMAFTTEEYDTDNFHDNSTNNTRITIPSGKGGKYLVTAIVNNYNASPGSYQLLRIYKNGSNYTDSGIREGIPLYSMMADANRPFGFATVVNTVAGDYLELYYQQGATSTTNLWCNFQAAYLGA